MDSSKFDELTKTLATPASRRQALKTLAATTFGGILALSGIGTAFAKKKCPPGQTNCGGKCVDTTKDPNNCGMCGIVCVSGLCVNSLCCASGANQCGDSCCTQTCCGTLCVDTNMDVNNCGKCGNVCRSDQICKGGQCVCPSGLTDCQGKCVDTNKDPNNCGGCGIVCPKGQVCFNGMCVTSIPMCKSGCFNPCNPSGTCYCNNTIEGTPACVQPVCLTGPCTSSADCPAGSICSTQGCCGGLPFCIPLCGGKASASVRTYGAGG